MRPEEAWIRSAVVAEGVRAQLQDTIFVSVNPDLKNAFGHFRLYEKQLEKHVRQLGGEYFCLAGREYNDAKAANWIPTFSKVASIYAMANAEGRRDERATAAKFLSEFREGLAKVRADGRERKRVVVFFYCGSARLASWLATSFADEDVYLTINGFWDFNDPAWTDGALYPPLKLSRNVRFLACSSVAADMLSNQTGLTFPWIPNPMPGFSDKDVLDKIGRIYPKGGKPRPTVFFPTLPSVGKGADAVSDFFPALSLDDFSRFTFIVRDSAGSLAPVLDQRFPGHDNIEILPKVVSDEALDAAFRRADIVVIPYNKDVFGFRTSGILVDTLVYGAVPVVLDNTWLSSICRQYDAGVIVEDASAPRLIEAVRRARADLPALQRASRRAAYGYCADNTWMGLLASVFNAHESFGLADMPGMGGGPARTSSRTAALVTAT